MSGYILSIDQGTTSSRAILFDNKQRIVAKSQKEFSQHFPTSGWVEHDCEEIWHSVLETCRTAIAKSGIDPKEIAGVGITNQRETTVVWNRKTGAPIHRAIVWQDRRTAAICAALKSAGHAAMVADKTGLLLDPYFSATKIDWLLDHVDGAREAANRGEILFGTMDCFLLWKLTGGQVHKTDATNAARTLLFNIHSQEWDKDLCYLFGVPMDILPQVCDCNHDFGTTVGDLLGASIPIAGMAGDQHAATIGQTCFEPGMIKSTYGTGCFVMMNTGTAPVRSHHGILTTIVYRIDGKVHYALEGSIFIAGAAVQWLRDGLKVIDHAGETGAMAAEADSSQRVILVPAFSGLGAPYWEPHVRGAVFGLTRNTGPRELARAALESVCYQTKDLMAAMVSDCNGVTGRRALRVDGGMVASEWTMQFLADTLACPVERPVIVETTALGAAWLAGYQTDTWPGMDAFAETWQMDRRFEPRMDPHTRSVNYSAWKAAVAAVIAQSQA